MSKLQYTHISRHYIAFFTISYLNNRGSYRFSFVLSWLWIASMTSCILAKIPSSTQNSLYPLMWKPSSRIVILVWSLNRVNGRTRQNSKPGFTLSLNPKNKMKSASVLPKLQTHVLLSGVRQLALTAKVAPFSHAKL